MNNLTLKGRLTANPELRTTSTGLEYCTFTVAVDRRTGKDKDKITDFIPCKAWRQTAVFINTYFKKGQEMILQGSINVDKYDKDGEIRTYTYVNVQAVEFCGSKNQTEQVADSTSLSPISNDDIPDFELDDLPI